MNPTEYPAPETIINVLDEEVRVKVTDLGHATAISLLNIWVNRIPVSFVIHFVYNEHYGAWSYQRYSADVRRQDMNHGAPATQNQISKLCAALSDALRSELDASLLLAGQTAHLGRTMERAQARVDFAQQELDEMNGYLRHATVQYEVSALATP